MSAHNDTNDRQLEEIVAYLDGELSGEECARVERRLAADNDFRQQLQSMERAWTALDRLPMATVDDRFSRTTLSMVVETAARDLETRTRAVPMARRRRLWATVAGAVAAAACGFLAFRVAWPNPNDALAADLAVIDNIDVYLQFQDVAFLQRLQESLGDDLEQLSGDARSLDNRLEQFHAVASRASGSQWLQGLTDEQRTNLRAKYNRFRDLDEAEQQRLRDLHQAVSAAPDAARLQRTMLAYQQWLSGLPPVRQFELRTLDDVDRRVALVRRWSGQMRDDALLTLDDRQLEQFFDALRGPMGELRDAVLREEKRDGRGGDRARFGVLLGQRFQRWRRELVSQFDERQVDRRFSQAVLDALPEPTREQFARLEPNAKVERFLTWMRQHTVCQGEVTREELEQFFAEELDPEMQEQLLSLPPDEMEKRLRQMYQCPSKFLAQGRWLWEPNKVGSPMDFLQERGDERGRRRGGPPLEFGPPPGFEEFWGRPGFAPDLGPARPHGGDDRRHDRGPRRPPANGPRAPR
ncbi:MAG TPA: hypothetical protein PKC18_05105 [Lacipirellulaceae bacterium]|nr:hypothetical protein [Lacipirellulaceae bacterium]